MSGDCWGPVQAVNDLDQDNWIQDRSYRHISRGMLAWWECDTRNSPVEIRVWAPTEAEMNGARWENYQMLRRLRHVADYFKLCMRLDQHSTCLGATSLSQLVWIWSQIPNTQMFCFGASVFLALHWSAQGGLKLELRLGGYKWKRPLCQISWYWHQIRTPDKMLDIKTQLNICKRFVLGPPAHY